MELTLGSPSGGGGGGGGGDVSCQQKHSDDMHALLKASRLYAINSHANDVGPHCGPHY